MTEIAASPQTHSSAIEILDVPPRFGLASFGGPVTHIGYFRAECVDDALARLV